MAEDYRIVAGPDEAGLRIDVVLARKTALTRSRLQRLIEEGGVTVNGSPVTSHYRLREQDIAAVHVPTPEADRLIPEPLPLEVLARDDSLIVVNKPAGMVVYPAAGHGSGTLMNAVAFACGRLASVGGPVRNGVVHRLDKDTSGVMVIALEDAAYYDLVEQFRERTILRRYQAIVHGVMKTDRGEISRAIGRSTSDRKKMSTTTRRGKEAVTRWEVLERFRSATLIAAKLGTGRTHQIRVHFASIGHPVLGDETYGKKTVVEAGSRRIAIPRQMLHAELLGFRHPATGAEVSFSTPLPEDMKAVLELLGVTKIS